MILTAANETTSATPISFHLKHFILNVNPYINSFYQRQDIHPDIEKAKELVSCGKGIYAAGIIDEKIGETYLIVSEFFKNGSIECFKTLDGTCYMIA